MKMKGSAQAEIDQHKWFHGLDFGDGIAAKGRLVPENWSLYGILSFLENIDLDGCRVLDLGTMDGLVAFIAEKKGATVVATDLYDRPSMYLAMDLLRSSVTYLPNTSIEDLLAKFGPGSFDLIVMGGLLYHLVSPLRGILIGRHLLKQNGLLLLETVATDAAEPTLLFNPAAPVVPEYTTYFVPTIEAVRQMMRFCSFKIAGSNKISVGPHVRGSVMGQAVPLDRAEPSTEVMRAAQERGAQANDRILDEFGLGAVSSESSPFAEVPSSDSTIEIDRFSFVTSLPIQPS